MNNKYWVCGKQTVLEVLKFQSRKIEKILIFKKNKDYQKNNFFEKFQKITEFKSNEEISNTLNDFEIRHQGYAALVSSIHEYKNKKEYIKKMKTAIALNNITDTRNIGSIIRSSAAFGVDAVIVEKKNFKENSLAMNKTSCGALEKIKVLKYSNIKYAIEEFKHYNFNILSFSSNSDNIINNQTFGEKNLLIFGSEGKGVSEIIKKKSDQLVKINTKNNQSINVSCSVSSVLTLMGYLNNEGK